MELMVKKEISEILTMLQDNGHTVQIGKILAPAVINILWELTSGSRISREDPRLNQLLEFLNIRSKAFDMSGGTLTQYPWLRFIAPEKTGYSLIKKLNSNLKNLLLETITEHYETWAEGKNDDFIYSFITEMKKSNGNKTTFTEDQLIMVCLDIFIAGSQTTSNTLDFAFLMMILYPDIQNKVQACLDQAFSQTQEINYTDRLRVPYVEAVLMEVERYCHVTPICGPRRVLQDTSLEGYYIPKDTTILISLYSVHNDKNYWADPGKRRCLGEILARNCIFLFFTEVIRKYEIAVLPGTKKPTGKPLPGISLSPEDYRAQFTPRVVS
ncbi:hypothetical protein NQ314_017179 [Rhamnusium bicolor]|uniref:Cytochrome P450 n=1 Tax=Rhamnusium bicolor TaxID=1586634 RepID=A0AAV8WV76_9CUCU|nr:hypothetical protein NQ314_017179 [Rhamnusium bicolor]